MSPDPDNPEISQEPANGSAAKSKGWQPPAPEQLQRLLPQYAITALLGRGGMGAVYKGTQINLDRAVAIKILPPGLDDRDEDANYAERFKNEARAMAKLSHPGIVAVYDFGETADGLLYIVMEFIEGTDVSRMVARQGRLHSDHALSITAHVCDALQYAHERGIIHRDIKPANIMVGYDGVVKVADFGLAKISQGGESGLTRSGMTLGTLHYMAPEALMLGAAVDHRADLYAVGVMLYYMLTGSLPQGMFAMPSQQIPGVDPRFDDIIVRALRNDRELRYPSAAALRADLDSILTQPVLKVNADDENAPAALPTDARPQKPAGEESQDEEDIDDEEYLQEIEVVRKTNAPLLWAVMLLIGGLSAWMAMERNHVSSPATSNQQAPAPTAPSEPPPVSASPQLGSEKTPLAPQPVTVAQAKEPQPVVPEPVSLPGATMAKPVEKPEPPAPATMAPVTSPVVSIVPVTPVVSKPTITPLSRRVRTQSLTIPNDALSFKTSRYKFFRESLAWNDAKRRAEAMGGHLATITSAEEQRWLQRSMPSGIKAVTLGGELAPNGKWRWITGEPWVFTAWAKKSDGTGEPNGAGANAKLEYMTYFYGPDGGWNDMFEDEGLKLNQSIRAFLVEWDNSAPLNLNDAQVTALDDAFAAAYEKQAAQPWIEDMTTLRGQYVQALERRRDELQQAGQSQSVSILENEIAVMRSGQDIPADGTADHALLRDLRRTFRDNAKRHLAEREKRTAPLYDSYARALQTHEAELLRDNKKDAAAAIKALREAVQKRQIIPLASPSLSLASSVIMPATVPIRTKNVFVWTDLRGQEILADFVAVENDTLVMRLQSQATARMPLNTLSTESRQLAQDLQKMPGQPDWLPLVEGNSLVGWKGDVTGYQIVNGVLTSTLSGGDLISDKEYGSFHLKFDLRLSSGANNGIGVWCAEDKGAFKYLSHTGFEIQLLDNNAQQYANIERWQQHASIFGMQGPVRKVTVTAGHWSSHEIIVQNDRITVIIDGSTVQDAELARLKAQDNSRPLLDLSKRRGHLVLCGRQGPVEFRNMRIKEL
ncbi:MAG: protein kinase [Verrucomicrobiaceae bacterium]